MLLGVLAPSDQSKCKPVSTPENPPVQPPPEPGYTLCD